MRWNCFVKREMEMKKTLVALSVFGLFAGVAQAQSNVTIYGVLDVGYVKETGRDLRMGLSLIHI